MIILAPPAGDLLSIGLVVLEAAASVPDALAAAVILPVRLDVEPVLVPVPVSDDSVAEAVVLAVVPVVRCVVVLASGNRTC